VIPPVERVVALGVVTATARRAPAGCLESSLISAVTTSRKPWTVAAARVTTRLGSRPVALLGAGLADAITAKRSRALPAPSAVLVVTAGMAARALLSDVIARPRPRLRAGSRGRTGSATRLGTPLLPGLASAPSRVLFRPGTSPQRDLRRSDGNLITAASYTEV
jgi:hypothetical protein